ncbi:unnamed protein product [Closterium sp. NIES-65]|nr:unnamed protein product [Closterium sp. NIES-65]
MDELKLWLSRLPAPTDLVILIDTRLIRRIPNLDLKFRPHASAHAPALPSTDSATGRPTLIGGISIFSFNRAISMSSPLPSADGRLLTVHLNYLREQIRLIAIYAPTQFYERRVWWTTTLAPALEAPTAAAASMLVGDFNSVVLPIDRNRPLKDFEMREGTSFAKLMDDHALVDTFRTLYPTPIDVFSFYGRQRHNSILERDYLPSFIPPRAVDELKALLSLPLIIHGPPLRMQCILTEPLAFNRSLLKPDGRPFATRQHERFLLTIPEEFHDDATRILPELIKAIKRPWWTALRTPHVSCASSGDWFMLSDDHYSISHLALRVIAYIPPSSVSANVHLVSPDHHITHTPANTGLFRLQDLIEVHVRDWWLAGPLHTGAGLGARIDLLQDGVPSLADIRRLLYRAQPLTHHSRWTRDLTLPPPPLPGLKDPFLKDQPSRQRDILFRLYTLTLPSGSRFQYFDDRGVHCALATRLPTKLASALHHALVVRPPVPPRTFFAAKSPPRLPISTSQPQHRLAAAICHRRRIGASPPHRRLAAWPPQRRAASRSPPHRHPQRTFSLPHNALPLPSLCSHSPPIPSFPFASLLDVLVAHPFPSPPFPSFALPALPFPSPFFPSFTLPAIPFPSPPFPFLPLFCPPCTSLPLSSLPFPSLVLPSLHYPSPLLPSLSFPSFALPALPFPSPFFPFLHLFCPPCTSLPLSSLPFPLYSLSLLFPSLPFASLHLPALSFFSLPPLFSPYLPFFLPTSPFFSLPPLFSPCLPFFLPASPFFSMPPLFSPCLPFFLHASPFFSLPPLFSPCLPFFLHASPFFSLDHYVSMPCHLL